MPTPMRINDSLFKEAEAEAEGVLMRRSAAKQVEFWAELGKHLSRKSSNDDILALM